MIIKLSELRTLIRSVLLEVGGASPRPARNVTNNPSVSSMSNREQIGKISVKQLTDDEEIAPHLQDRIYDEEDCQGPVKPSGKNPYALPDFYAKDYGVLPTGTIRR